VVNAVIDALSPFGVTDIGRPLSPERVWRAVHRGGGEPPQPDMPGAGSGLGSAARLEQEGGQQ
jgi:carbon-monoxide dehydrogenase large subunit